LLSLINYDRADKQKESKEIWVLQRDELRLR
jgi:hypothetical protein